jgi:hypothetical protein
MATMVQASEKTLRILNKLKKEMRAKSKDDIIKALISERKKTPESMFGANPNLNSYTQKDKTEFHEL